MAYPPATQGHTYFHILNQKLILEHNNRQKLPLLTIHSSRENLKESHSTNFYLASYGKAININLQPFCFKSFLIQDVLLKQQPIPNWKQKENDGLHG
jgi:hypothetical protein